jgi:hypothetical protein
MPLFGVIIDPQRRLGFQQLQCQKICKVGFTLACYCKYAYLVYEIIRSQIQGMKFFAIVNNIA